MKVLGFFFHWRRGGDVKTGNMVAHYFRFLPEKKSPMANTTQSTFLENMVLSGTDILSDTGHRCKEVNRAQKNSRAPSETEKSAGKPIEANNEKLERIFS